LGVGVDLPRLVYARPAAMATRRRQTNENGLEGAIESGTDSGSG
jgi:hypothetical protein